MSSCVFPVAADNDELAKLVYAVDAYDNFDPFDKPEPLANEVVQVLMSCVFAWGHVVV